MLLLLAVARPGPIQAGGSVPGFAVEEFHQRAPGFELTDLAGKTVRSEDTRGKCLLLHLFATWCTACRHELPGLAAARTTAQAQGCRILAVAVNERGGAAEVSAYLDDLGIRDSSDFALPVLLTDDYWSWGIPVTYWIDSSGIIRGRMLGPRDWSGAAKANLFAEFAAAAPDGQNAE